MAKRQKKKGHALRRRYGHFGMADVENGVAHIRRLATDNPTVTAAVFGATSAALASGMPTGAAAVLGATAAIAVEKASKHGGKG